MACSSSPRLPQGRELYKSLHTPTFMYINTNHPCLLPHQQNL